MDLNKKITEMANSKLPDASQFLVDVVISGNRVQKKIVVIVDGDSGVNIEDCARISRVLSAELDKINLIEEKFTLEVSTPGLDQSLKMKRQYKKNEGREFKIILKDKSILNGTLISSDDNIEIKSEKKVNKKKEIKTEKIPFDLIDKAFVQISFK